MMAGRVLHAGLQLLDRQLVDRNGHLCGKVDDLELSLTAVVDLCREPPSQKCR